MAARSNDVYEIVANEELPMFDATIKMKDVLLRPRARQVFNALLWRFKPLLLPSYFFGHCLRLVALFTPIAIGRWVALAAPLFEFPMIVVTLLSFRIEYIRVITRTFDYWFFTTTNTIWLTCAVLIFQDARIALLPVCWLAVQNAVSMDAFFSNFSAVIAACIAMAAMLFAWEAGIAMQLIDEMHSVALVSTQHHTISADDVMANATGTILVLLVRLIYRRRSLAHREWGMHFQTVQSMAYRCKVRLQRCGSTTQGLTGTALPDTRAAPSTSRSDTPAGHQAQSPVDTHATRLASPTWHPAPVASEAPNTEQQLPRMLAMRFVTPSVSFDAADIVAPWMRVYAWPMTSVVMVALYTIGIVCPALTLAIEASGRELTSTQCIGANVLAGVTVVATILFCGQFVCLYQRQLLRRVCTSFDFVFLSLQLTLALVAVCDLVQWDWHRCSPLVASWIWTHWVMTLDALLPVLRREIAFDITYAIPVVLVRLVLQCVLVYYVAGWNEHLGWRNRLLVHGVIAGHDVRIYVLPFAASRVVTNVVWCVRLLWRIAQRDSVDELIMLQGNVEYDCVRMRRKRTTVLATALARVRNSRLSNAFQRTSAVVVPSSSLSLQHVPRHARPQLPSSDIQS